MERLLSKSFFGEECPREACIEKTKAWVDCDKDRTIEENLYDLQAESLWRSNGYTSTVFDDIPGSYEEVASFSYCSVRGQFWWENVCVGVFLTLLLFHQQAQPCQIWQLVCTSDKKRRFTTQWQWDHPLSSIANGKRDGTSKQLLISEENNLNKDAKTVGGVKRFSADNDAVTKWTMGTADQARKLDSLLLMCTWPS